MKLSQFKFDLPLNLIAQNPTKRREDSRLMVIERATGKIENKHFKDVLDYFDDKDVFVVNNTKVFPARMYGRKEKTGAKIEVFLLRELNKPNRLWDVIVDPARKIRVGNPPTASTPTRRVPARNGRISGRPRASCGARPRPSAARRSASTRRSTPRDSPTTRS